MRSYQTDTNLQASAEPNFIDFGWIGQGIGGSTTRDLPLTYGKQKAVNAIPRPHILVIWISVLLISTTAFWITLRRFSGSQNSVNEVPLSGSADINQDLTKAKEDSNTEIENDFVVSANPNPDNVSPIATFFTPEVRHWASHISRWAQLYELDPNMIATIMQIESCGNPQAVSHAGAQGLFQVMPFHFQPGENMQDPDTNAKRGLAFMKKQLEFTGGDIYLSFAGYNGGYAASGGQYDTWPHETKRYFYWAKGIYTDGIAGADHSPRLDEWLNAGGQSACITAAKNLGI